jgi:hypothetical protein
MMDMAGGATARLLLVKPSIIPAARSLSALCRNFIAVPTPPARGPGSPRIDPVRQPAERAADILRDARGDEGLGHACRRMAQQQRACTATTSRSARRRAPNSVSAQRQGVQQARA